MKILQMIGASVLLIFAISIWANTGTTITWTAPAEREDNTAISLSEIAGYRIYYGTTAGDYQNSIIIEDSIATEYHFTELDAGTYYVVMTVIDTDGRESRYSDEIIIVVPIYLAPPYPITNLILSVGIY